MYSSPYTRCIQTAIQISEGFKEVSGKELKIRVEYGLAENINSGKEYLPKIDNGEITEDFYPDFFYKDREGNIKYKPFDDYLSYESHKKNYANHLDLSYHRGPIIIFLKNEKHEERDFVLIDYTENNHSGESIRLINLSSIINNLIVNKLM